MYGLQIFDAQAPHIAVRHFQRAATKNLLKVKRITAGPEAVDSEGVADGVRGFNGFHSGFRGFHGGFHAPNRFFFGFGYYPWGYWPYYSAGWDYPYSYPYYDYSYSGYSYPSSDYDYGSAVSSPVVIYQSQPPVTVYAALAQA